MMTQSITVPKLKNLIPAATESIIAIEACLTPITKMEIPNSERTNVAVTLSYASLEQARSACFLVAKDTHRSLLGALILLRSQVDQLMRGAFFSGPATEEELKFYLAKDKLPKRNGSHLGPISLSVINEQHFNWQPAGRVTNTIKNSWDALSGMTHGGHALINFYTHEDGIGPYPATDGFIELLTNAVAMAHLAVTISLAMATNSANDDLQKDLKSWFEAGQAYFDKWVPKQAVEANA